MSYIQQWLAHEPCELFHVLAEVVDLKMAGAFSSGQDQKTPPSADAPQESQAHSAEVLRFGQFADTHFLSPAIVSQLENKEVMAAQAAALTLDSTDVQCSSAALTGGKGSSLAVLNSIKGIAVPNFFCVTTHAFRQHFAQQAEAAALLAFVLALLLFASSFAS